MREPELRALLTEDIRRSWQALRLDPVDAPTHAARCQLAMESTEMPGQGKLTICVLSGVDYGLWEKQGAGR